MHTRYGIIVALGILLAVGTAQGATLVGSVRTADGDLIAARITILRNSGGVSLDTRDTAADGTFSIELEEAGVIAAAASAAGYASQEIDLSNGVPSGLLRFVLRKLRTVRGIVKDSGGAPLQGAKVNVRNPDSTRRIHVDYYRTVVTDASGTFTVEVPAGGAARFVADVTAEAWVPRSSGVFGSGSVGSTGVGEGSPCVCPSHARTARDEHQRPRDFCAGGSALEGITVLAGVRTQHARADEGAFSGGVEGPGTGTIRPYGLNFRTRTVTDNDGRYTISGLPPGRLSVVAIKPDIRVPVQQFNSVEGGSSGADFVLPD